MIDALPLDRFHDLVAAYGANPDRWPADQRPGAVACLVESEAAREAWRDAAELDVDLDGVAGFETPPELVEKVMAIGGASQKPHTGILGGALRYVVPYAAAAAIALIVGLAAPSPFRDGTGTSAQDEIALSEPSNTSEINGGLTDLALVDGGDSGVTLSDESSLADLPLL
jgi:hypothetical protein